MSLNNSFLKSFRIILFPLACIWFVVLITRHYFYKKGWLRSVKFNLPIINVGNISVGGTGKSPMVMFLLQHFSSKYQMATLSRGFKRKTKGFLLATEGITPENLGDEPFLIHKKFPLVPVCVGEDRLQAVPQLLYNHEKTQAIILDDALQHRPLQAGLNLLLTSYTDLYTEDFYLPTGNLRDVKQRANDCAIIVVTKCPTDLSETEKEKIVKKINPQANQTIYFTAIEYGHPYHLFTNKTINLQNTQSALLVTGIANPTPLKQHIEKYVHAYFKLSYPDHHIFSVSNINDIEKRFNELPTSKEKIILTTEKDAVRLLKFAPQIGSWPIYAVPIQLQFLFNQQDKFLNQIDQFIKTYEKEN
jgi:tetraacyldisaccharide 4'-kinase